MNTYHIILTLLQNLLFGTNFDRELTPKSHSKQQIQLIFRKGRNYGQQIQESSPLTVVIKNPGNPFPFISGRKNNPFAAIAESFWVLSGQTDIEFLSYYLPRAKDFSDDGTYWRGGYGGRIRNWKGFDQLIHVYELLKQKPDTRQALISIYDPETDSPATSWSKDIPCNNLLHFIIRDGKLNLYVYIRSNDLIWGFSGINLVEWSMLQTVLAKNLGVSVGSYHHFAGSLHIYEHHWETANKIIEKYTTEHEFGFSTKRNIQVTQRELQLDIPFQDMNAIFARFYSWHDELINPESEVTAQKLIQQIRKIAPDSTGFQTYLQLLSCFTLYKQDNAKVFIDLVHQMLVTHPVLACLHYLLRVSKGIFRENVFRHIKGTGNLDRLKAFELFEEKSVEYTSEQRIIVT